MKNKGLMTLLLAMFVAVMICGCGAKESAGDAPADAATEENSGDTETAGEADTQDSAADADTDDEKPANTLVLTGATYTGLTNLKNENNDDGTYFYQDMTEDGVTIITNMSYPNSQRDGQDMGAYAQNFICALVDNDAKVDDPQEDSELAAKLTYPVYIATWETGSNEDTKQAIGVVVLTDLYTYYYGFSCPIDDYEDNEEFYKGELAALQLNEF